MLSIKINDFENECNGHELLIKTDRSLIDSNHRKLSVKFEMVSDDDSTYK